MVKRIHLMQLLNFLAVMNLKEKFTKYNSTELITIAETNSDYTDDAKNIAIDIITEREKNGEINIEKAAKEYWHIILRKNLKSLIKNKKIPKSHFLNDHQMKEMIKLAFEDWKDQQDLFGIDITKYWATF